MKRSARREAGCQRPECWRSGDRRVSLSVSDRGRSVPAVQAEAVCLSSLQRWRSTCSCRILSYGISKHLVGQMRDADTCHPSFVRPSRAATGIPLYIPDSMPVDKTSAIWQGAGRGVYSPASPWRSDSTHGSKPETLVVPRHRYFTGRLPCVEIRGLYRSSNRSTPPITRLVAVFWKRSTEARWPLNCAGWGWM